MSRIERAMRELHTIDREASAEGWVQAIYPLSKLIVTLTYLIILLSFDKYSLTGTLLMGIYPLVLFLAGDISIRHMGRRLWVLLLLVMIVGIANPFFDHRPMFVISGFTVTSGMVSMLTLMLKGVFALTAVYLLMVTTTIYGICHALRIIRVPAVLVTILMLVYRYLMVLLKEVDRMSTAYAMRSPGQKGIHFRVWGSMAGLLLLRSIDRAKVVYESMQLRGFRGEFKPFCEQTGRMSDYLYVMVWIILFILIRFI